IALPPPPSSTLFPYTTLFRSRTLTAQLDNQGTVTVTQPLTMNRSNSAHTNSGTIDVSADLTVNLSGSPASFTNVGTMTVGAGRTERKSTRLNSSHVEMSYAVC